MPDPGSRVRSYNTGDTPTAGELDAIQDNYVANHNRIHTRKVPVSVTSNVRILNGAPVIDNGPGGKVVSVLAFEAVDIDITQAVWSEPAHKIVGCRAQVNQVVGAGSDKWVMELHEFDPSNVDTLIATVTSDDVAGWKTMDLGPLDRLIPDLYRWKVSLQHNNAGPGTSTLELTMIEVQLGG